jgi:hypothetical protein
MEGTGTRWDYDRLADEVDRLANEMLDRRAEGGSEAEWIAGQDAIARAIADAGWTQEEFESALDHAVERALTSYPSL